MAKIIHLLPTCALLALAFSFTTLASDPGPLQDFCVAINDPKSAVFVNGKFCKNPKQVTINDFFFTGLDIPAKITNAIGSKSTSVDVNDLPGLNTLGVSFSRIDFAPKGLNSLHTHPRASEILFVSEGTLLVGFVTTDLPNGQNKFFPKVLNKGDVFVFPMGLIHFQFNIANTNAVAFSAFSSQNPGENTIANAVFGSTPPISSDVLTRAFQVDNNTIAYLQKQFWHDYN